MNSEPIEAGASAARKSVAVMCAIATVLGLMSGCTRLSPGIHLDDDDFEYSRPLREGETPEIPVLTISPEVIAAESARLAAAVPAVPAPSHEASAPAAVESPNFSASAEGYRYRIGIGDVLGITVYERPELSSAIAGIAGVAPSGVAGGAAMPTSPGVIVDPDGSIYFPYVGQVKVVDLTVGQARARLETALSTYIRDPKLDLRVAEYRSQQVRVTGAGIPVPVTLPIADKPVTVLDAVRAAGSLSPAADLSRLRLTRAGKSVEVNVSSFGKGATLADNWVLQGGDLVYIPDSQSSRIFVVGEVVKQQAVPMVNGQLSLADALAAVNGPTQASADARRIYIIRGGEKGSMEDTKVFHLNAQRPDALLLATRFEMQPRDVVYVSTASVVRFQRTLSAILPSLSFVRDLDRLVTP